MAPRRSSAIALEDGARGAARAGHLRLGRRRQDHDGRGARAAGGALRAARARLHHRPLAAPGDEPRQGPAHRTSARDRHQGLRAGARRRALRDGARRQGHLRRARAAPHAGGPGARPDPQEPLLPPRLGRARGQPRVHGDGEAARARERRPLRPGGARHAAHAARARLPRGARPAAGLPGRERPALLPAPVLQGRPADHAGGDAHGCDAAEARRPLPGAAVPAGAQRVLPGLRGDVRRLPRARLGRAGAAARAEHGLRAGGGAAADGPRGGALLPQAPRREEARLRGLRRQPRAPRPRARARGTARDAGAARVRARRAARADAAGAAGARARRAAGDRTARGRHAGQAAARARAGTGRPRPARPAGLRRARLPARP